ncbi:hypothetical protein [Phaeobacter gallaeciensis]|uniref:Uncharacterized protein n=1 Tax=Phaeobacter gallaeciensis TaxID=60890 RepID=A0AAC9Z8Q9_9RHOB|nr:hypothetical protein [Phaeobacter gallaeciensis]AHD10033.1 hypothetical protein Gal_02286 [Phaeobacter gallaeciensis DSM 26640]ATE93297.1 hypothetical protein PhaeoP11_02277 [Phaeobacter gallaeciensis]ATE96882.1 hypothetical protein PhaeoP73_01570 [Phaeobacter gallaeciensis]ATF01961.1 hypothetical protein PhaeoP75_02326 [Phaeobacter gallaeciensis]ATF06341.1 hypothetical protein PhaeoP63_02275 [Phaeobacter gallaeciensis]
MTIHPIHVIPSDDGIYKTIGGDLDVTAPLGTGFSDISSLSDAVRNCFEDAHPALPDLIIKLFETEAAAMEKKAKGEITQFHKAQGLRFAAKTIAQSTP